MTGNSGLLSMSPPPGLSSAKHSQNAQLPVSVRASISTHIGFHWNTFSHLSLLSCSLRNTAAVAANPGEVMDLGVGCSVVWALGLRRRLQVRASGFEVEFRGSDPGW